MVKLVIIRLFSQFISGKVFVQFRLAVYWGFRWGFRTFILELITFKWNYLVQIFNAERGLGGLNEEQEGGGDKGSREIKVIIKEK